jgi:transposase
MEAGSGGGDADLCHGAGDRSGFTIRCNADHSGGSVMTSLLPPNVKVHLALGFIDMRKGIDGLAMLVQGVLHQDPFTGHLFVFRGRTRANLIKIIYWDGTGFCLFTKRLEHGVFLWPPSIEPSETLSLTSAQLSLLIEGVDWRAPEQRWRPAIAG